MDPILWSILLLLVGLGLVILDLFVPSAGVLSLIACACVLLAIGFAFTSSEKEGVIILAITAVLIPAVLATAVKFWPRTPIGRMVLIGRPEHPDDVLPDSEEYRGLAALIGKIGISITKMLPSGIVEIDGQGYDAVSEGMPIDQGLDVQVVDVRTNRLIVRPAPEGATPLDETESDVLSKPIDSLGIEGLDDPLA